MADEGNPYQPPAASTDGAEDAAPAIARPPRSLRLGVLAMVIAFIGLLVGTIFNWHAVYVLAAWGALAMAAVATWLAIAWLRRMHAERSKDRLFLAILRLVGNLLMVWVVLSFAIEATNQYGQR